MPEFTKLCPQLCEFFHCEMDCLAIKVERPSTPRDMGAKLRLRHDMGTPSTVSSATMSATSSLILAFWSRIKRSSTYSHKRRGVVRSSPCSRRLSSAPRRCHQ